MNHPRNVLDHSLPSDRSPVRFEQVYSELALHQAALKAYTKGLFSWRKAANISHDGGTLYDFARCGPQHLEQLHRQLRRQTFSFREGLELEYNFNGKKRRVYLFPWEERIVDIWLFQALNRHFHSAFSASVYAYRHRDYGVDRCQHQVARTLRQLPQPVYLFKRDIRNYFPSIDHELLRRAIALWVADDYLRELLCQRVAFRFRRPDVPEIQTASRGVAFGTPIACFLANLFLVPLDRAMRGFDGIRYFRYADDMLVVGADRQEVLRSRGRFKEVLGRLRLESKPSQHRDVAFLPAGEVDDEFTAVRKFRHLGLDFRADGQVGLAREKLRKIRNLFRFAIRRNRRKWQKQNAPRARAQAIIDICRDVIERGLRPVAIIDYYLKHVTDEDQLRLLDRWLAEEVLAQTFGTGHRKGNFRKLSFRAMRDMGLPSLRHRRRLLQHGHLHSSFFQLRQDRLFAAKRRRLSSRDHGISSTAGSTGNETSVRKDAGC